MTKVGNASTDRSDKKKSRRKSKHSDLSQEEARISRSSKKSSKSKKGADEVSNISVTSKNSRHKSRKANKIVLRNGDEMSQISINYAHNHQNNTTEADMSSFSPFPQKPISTSNLSHADDFNNQQTVLNRPLGNYESTIPLNFTAQNNDGNNSRLHNDYQISQSSGLINQMAQDIQSNSIYQNTSPNQTPNSSQNLNEINSNLNQDMYNNIDSRSTNHFQQNSHHVPYQNADDLMQNPHNNFQNVDQKIANLSINSNNSTSTKVSIEQSEYQEFLNFKRSKERNNSSNSSQNGTKQKRNSSQNSPVLSSSSTHSSRHTSNRQRSSENYNPTLSKLPLNNQSRAFHHTQGIGQQCNNSFEDSVHSDASYISKRSRSRHSTTSIDNESRYNQQNISRSKNRGQKLSNTKNRHKSHPDFNANHLANRTRQHHSFSKLQPPHGQANFGPHQNASKFDSQMSNLNQSLSYVIKSGMNTKGPNTPITQHQVHSLMWLMLQRDKNITDFGSNSCYDIVLHQNSQGLRRVNLKSKLTNFTNEKMLYSQLELLPGICNNQIPVNEKALIYTDQHLEKLTKKQQQLNIDDQACELFWQILHLRYQTAGKLNHYDLGRLLLYHFNKYEAEISLILPQNIDPEFGTLLILGKHKKALDLCIEQQDFQNAFALSQCMDLFGSQQSTANSLEAKHSHNTNFMQCLSKFLVTQSERDQVLLPLVYSLLSNNLHSSVGTDNQALVLQYWPILISAIINNGSAANQNLCLSLIKQITNTLRSSNMITASLICEMISTTEYMSEFKRSYSSLIEKILGFNFEVTEKSRFGRFIYSYQYAELLNSAILLTNPGNEFMTPVKSLYIVRMKITTLLYKYGLKDKIGEYFKYFISSFDNAQNNFDMDEHDYSYLLNIFEMAMEFGFQHGNFDDPKDQNIFQNYLRQLKDSKFFNSTKQKSQNIPTVPKIKEHQPNDSRPQNNSESTSQKVTKPSTTPGRNRADNPASGIKNAGIPAGPVQNTAKHTIESPNDNLKIKPIENKTNCSNQALSSKPKIVTTEPSQSFPKNSFDYFNDDCQENQASGVDNCQKNVPHMNSYTAQQANQSKEIIPNKTPAMSNSVNNQQTKILTDPADLTRKFYETKKPVSTMKIKEPEKKSGFLSSIISLADRKPAQKEPSDEESEVIDPDLMPPAPSEVDPSILTQFNPNNIASAADPVASNYPNYIAMM